LPALGQKNHFKLPNTIAGNARKILRHELASLLGMGGHEFEYFLTEAMSIIIPIIILPHRDKMNDGKTHNQSGTVQVRYYGKLDQIGCTLLILLLLSDFS